MTDWATALGAELHGHSTTDFSWLFDASKKRTKRDQGVWSVIAEALPHRTYKSVWGAGMRMFHPGNYQVGRGGLQWLWAFGTMLPRCSVPPRASRRLITMLSRQNLWEPEIY